MHTAKPRMSPLQKTMSETTGRSVVTEVRTVRESVAFTQRFTRSGKSVFWSRFSSSRTRSKSTIVSFTP